MNGFFIQVTNNLFDPKHRRFMGDAVWEFMWCLDKITKVDDFGKGWVLGGKPVNLADFERDLGTHYNSVSRHLKRLEKHGYITLLRTPYGMRIVVNKAKKRFTKNGERFTKNESRITRIGDRNIRQYQDRNKDIEGFKNFRT
jgi:DNA-binding transcriptional ArsR family regulator